MTCGTVCSEGRRAPELVREGSGGVYHQAQGSWLASAFSGTPIYYLPSTFCGETSTSSRTGPLSHFHLGMVMSSTLFVPVFLIELGAILWNFTTKKHKVDYYLLILHAFFHRIHVQNTGILATYCYRNIIIKRNCVVMPTVQTQASECGI